MRRFLTRAFLASVLLGIPAAGYPAAYEASSLFNSVGRSETVQDLFLERWDTILERRLYVDWYGKINWVNNFKVNTINSGNGQKQSIPMTLVRTYGSFTANLPLSGGYGEDMENRLSGKKDDTKLDFDQGNLQVAFTMTGFHYGLTRKVRVDRGDAGNESATDYRFTQFFDDIFAFSLLYTPLFYVHGGLILNNQIEPNSDGTMDYSDSRDGFPKRRWFINSNLLSIFNVGATLLNSDAEKLSVGADFMSLAECVTSVPGTFPRVIVTWKRLSLYNDEAYDAVWVRSAYASDGTAKSEEMAEGLRQRAKLYTTSIQVKENYKNIFFAEFFSEYQYCSATLVEKQTVTQSTPAGKPIKLNPLREIRGSAGVNVLGLWGAETMSLTFTGGIGRYWDPAIALHRTSGTGHSLTGYFGSVKFEYLFVGADFTASYNYSKELRKLVETADKLALEGSLFLRF